MPAIAQSGIHAATLTTTLAVVGSTVATGKQQRVAYIRVSNLTAISQTVDVSLHNGSTHFYLCQGFPLTAKGTAGSVVDVISRETFLPAGWSIYAVASNNAALNIVAPYLETSA